MADSENSASSNNQESRSNNDANEAVGIQVLKHYLMMNRKNNLNFSYEMLIL